MTPLAKSLRPGQAHGSDQPRSFPSDSHERLSGSVYGLPLPDQANPPHDDALTDSVYGSPALGGPRRNIDGGMAGDIGHAGPDDSRESRMPTDTLLADALTTTAHNGMAHIRADEALASHIGYAASPRQLVLASSSATRQRLMRTTGWAFQAMAPVDRERVIDACRLSPEHYVQAQAYLKARDVADRLAKSSASSRAALTPRDGLTSGLVIGVDTVSVLDGKILNKPASRRHAAIMLGRLSGRCHHVLSGVAIIDSLTASRLLGHARSTLEMASLDDATIQDLANRPQAIACAGGYALREDGCDPYVRLIDGDMTTVLGLPIPLLSNMLGQFLGFATPNTAAV